MCTRLLQLYMYFVVLFLVSFDIDKLFSSCKHHLQHVILNKNAIRKKRTKKTNIQSSAECYKASRLEAMLSPLGLLLLL